MNTVFLGDCRASMRKLIDDGVRVQCIVTSPPYWGLRDYGCDGQIGLEPTLQEFIAELVEVFDLCKQLLADDGTCWVNMGDSYAGSWGAQGKSPNRSLSPNQIELRQVQAAVRKESGTGSLKGTPGLKPKDLIGQPWRLAFALQDSGWWLRQDIIWHKPNPMPESISDRCTKAHEYLFLLTKSERYYFDADAIKEPVSPNTHARLSQDLQNQRRNTVPSGWDTGLGSHRKLAGRYEGSGVGFGHGSDSAQRDRGRVKNNASFNEAMAIMPTHRNKRSVWTISTESFSGAHFATFPQALVEPCILAGSRIGDIVFDPFMGSGTVAHVAERLGRKWIGCELNPEYVELIHQRTQQIGMAL